MNENETLDCDGELEAVQAAFDAWISIPDCDMPFVYGGPVPPSASRDFADDGANVVFWAVGVMLDPAVLALTAWTADAYGAVAQAREVDQGLGDALHRGRRRGRGGRGRRRARVEGRRKAPVPPGRRAKRQRPPKKLRRAGAKGEGVP